MDILNRLKKNISYPLITSVILHLSVFIAIGLSIDFSKTTPALGNTNNLVLNSYLFDDHFSQTITITENKTKNTVNKKEIAEKLPQLDKQTIALAKNTKAQTNKSPSIRRSKASDGEQTQALIALLHTAIQNQQHYPSSAIQMEREGRITLAFTLYTNGQISDLRIMKSSQTNSLDEAALAAVRAAAPFQQVNKYLKEAQEYSIDVVFELT